MLAPRAIALAASLAAALSLAASCNEPPPPEAPARTAAVTGTPLSYGRARLAAALEAAGSSAPARLVLASDPDAAAALAAAGVTLSAAAEAFTVVPDPGRDGGTLVVGRDEAGAMYGALEICDRLAAQGASALPLAAPLSTSPALPIRGANLFLALPEEGETSWWFHEEMFWREYLDVLARARINFLDLQGMYLLDKARFPNALLFFATSATHPDVGAPPAERAHNLRVLRRVVALAKERNIAVGLLTNRADDSMNAHDPGSLDDAQLAVYVREAAADLARNVPDLRRLGFRIGESMQPASFYSDTFIAGVREASTTMGVYTRTWLTQKDEILNLAKVAPDMLIEAKYNGEQIGPPYLMAGGLFGKGAGHGWETYSYDDYLEAPTPYSFIFQIWGGGTHRIFRHASYERISRVLHDVGRGPSRGFTLLATHAFLPQHDFYHASEADRFSPFAFRRDELEYLMFGRLGYDPATPEQVFKDALRERAGSDALWDSIQAASDIVPWIQSAHTCGPDQRMFAPDLEWGGTVGLWASAPDATNPDDTCRKTGYNGSFDTFAVASAYDTARDLLDGGLTTRLPSTEVAAIVLADAAKAREAAGIPIDRANAEARDLQRECVALADLGDYFGHKLRAATALAVYQGSGRSDYLDLARSETVAADQAWRTLGHDTHYIKPFGEPMRMRELKMSPYHWSRQDVRGDLESIDAVVLAPKVLIGNPDALPPAAAFLAEKRPDAPKLVSLVPTHHGNGWQVTATFDATLPEGATVRVFYKPFSGSSDWLAASAHLAGGSDTTWEAAVRLADDAGYFAVEVRFAEGGGRRYPEVLDGAPYVVIEPHLETTPPRAGPAGR
jgi:hypothetical protein